MLIKKLFKEHMCEDPFRLSKIIKSFQKLPEWQQPLVLQ